VAERRTPAHHPAREAPHAPSEVDSTEKLGAIDTACTVFDNEVDRLTRLLNAKEQLATVTPQVRALLATVQPMQARKDQLEAELTQMETRKASLHDELVHAEAAHAARLDAQAQALTQQQEAVAKEREALAAEEAAFAARRALMQQQREQEEQEAVAAHQERQMDMERELAGLEEQIHQAQQLRDQLTSLRG